ncbi:MAG: bifunctional 5,10-methylene-tetrahydrofolate dehydrogenase/5,10-methylene-tetrahydrofolate cyclohydrolase, partial [Gemmatimonadetes bacterium]|nr:bifunctional 5,10-methylene-tetrahydrofolate dehydrogenase/5,10-methylene-tetrahydrofolate cyclohydrolase [Gemmatimonadota bacterium]
MAAQIIDGKVISQAVRDEVAKEVEELKAAGVEPCLAVMLVGENPASQVYVGMKEKKCAEVGIRAVDQRLAAETSQEEILAILDAWNADPTIHGILVQLPLPDHVDEKTV